MLIPLPIACAIFALISDIVSVSGGPAGWYFMGYVLTIGMWVTGLLAAVPGLIDYFTVVTPGTQAKKTATIHLLLNLSIVALFFASWMIKNGSIQNGTVVQLPTASSIIIEVIGVGLLVASGWFGWSLVYKHRIGVDEQGVVEPIKKRAA